jgi:hypothetical protein
VLLQVLNQMILRLTSAVEGAEIDLVIYLYTKPTFANFLRLFVVCTSIGMCSRLMRIYSTAVLPCLLTSGYNCVADDY